MTFAEDLALAGELADLADSITLPRFRAQDLRVSTKPDRSPVTDADTATENTLRARLTTARPRDLVTGEEEGGDPTAAGRVWIIDPIDGTKNFLRGVPVWATLIALAVDGVPVVGMVSAPAMGRRWWAGAGAGAWTTENGTPRRIAVSAVAELADAYVSTTEITSWAEYHTQRAYQSLIDNCWMSRAFGDFWQHCLVAEGAIDIAAEPIVNPWDVAPLRVLVEEAGGRFTDLTGELTYAGGSALSTNGPLHDPALKLLTR